MPGPSGMTEPAPVSKGGLPARILRDPLTHFVVAGGLLFAVYAAFAPEPVDMPTDSMRIELTVDDLRQISLVMLSQGRAAPDPDQMRDLARQAAIQRILVREAKALGLDQDDEIIARRLAQKMDFLMADLATLDAPSEPELRAWYEQNLDRFQMPPRASFRHLYFSQDQRGPDAAKAKAAELLPTLAATGPDDAALSGLADRFMFRDYYGGRNPTEIAKEFGPEFADELFSLPTGQWAGPVRSGYGWHLVWIDSLEPGQPAAFDTIREAVSSAWLEERFREIRDTAYDEMLSRYTIVLPDPEAFDPRPVGEAAPGDDGSSGLGQ